MNLLQCKTKSLQFSLRVVLISFTILCAFLGWYLYRVDRQKKVVCWVIDQGGTVSYDYGEETNRPTWLQSIVGVDYLFHVYFVSLNDTDVADLEPLSSLVRLEYLNLYGSQVCELKPLAGLTHLKQLHLSDTQVNDLTPLGDLESLQTLILDRTNVSDLSPLANLSNLRVLTLSKTRVSESDVSELQRRLGNCDIAFAADK